MMVVVVLAVCVSMLKSGEMKNEIRVTNPKGVYGSWYVCTDNNSAKSSLLYLNPSPKPTHMNEHK
jgi:hypothetical protein